MNNQKAQRQRAYKAIIRKRRILFLRKLVLFTLFILILGLSIGFYLLYRGTISKILIYQEFFEEDQRATLISHGVILLDEDVMISPLGGRYRPLTENMAQVQVNDPLVEIYDKDSVLQYEEELKSIESSRQADLEEYNLRLAFYDESVIELEKEITSIEKELLKDTVKDDTSATERLKARLLILSQNIQELLTEKDLVKNNQAYWDEQEAGLIDVLSYNSTIIRSNYQGAVSYAIDGYETLLGTDKLNSISLKDLNSFPYGKSLNNSIALAAGKPFAKVIREPLYFIAAYPVKDVLTLQVGDQVKLLTTKEVVFPAEILSMEQEGNQVLITYKIERLNYDLIEYRFPVLELVTLEERGMKVPKETLTKRKGKEGVFLVEQGEARFYPVSVWQNRGGEALITGLSSGAKIILNPRFAIEGIKVGE